MDGLFIICTSMVLTIIITGIFVWLPLWYFKLRKIIKYEE